MKIAYIILAHKNPAQLGRLISRLEPSAPIVVHIDARSDIGPFQRMTSRFPSVLFSPRHRCRWGSFGIAKATLSSIRTLVASGSPFDYAMLLSGQDYPIKSRTQIADFLRVRAGGEFVESFALAKPNRWTNHGGPYQSMTRIQYLHIQIRSRHFMWPIKRRFPDGYEPFGGSQWWCLTRDCLAHIDRFASEHPEFINYYKYAFIPDEQLIQTIVSNSPFADKIIQDDLRFAIWDRPTPPYPATLDSSDLDRLSESSKLFARKFDQVSGALVFDQIDKRLLDPVVETSDLR